jgi:YtkA-like
MSQARRSVLAAASVLFLAAASACGDDPGASPAGSLLGEDGQPLPEGTVDCSADPRLDNYVSLDKYGELGVLSFRLAEVEPAPPAKGNNTFHLQISDAGGTPLDGELRVDLKMPDHGHGTSVKPHISFDPETGEYTVAPLYLFMPGVWRVQLDAYETAATGAVPLDRTALFFCIQG